MLYRAVVIKSMRGDEVDALHRHEIKMLADFRGNHSGYDCNGYLTGDNLIDWLKDHRGMMFLMPNLDPKRLIRTRQYVDKLCGDSWMSEAVDWTEKDGNLREQRRMHALDWHVFRDKSFPIYTIAVKRRKIDEVEDWKSEAAGG